jgi:cellulose synthase/poly-beta-1,6-N-acetylglucosamine synthase-like glycosyltransferase
MSAGQSPVTDLQQRSKREDSSPPAPDDQGALDPTAEQVLGGLQASGKLSDEQAREARDIYWRHRTPLLDILTTLGWVRPRDYAREMARATHIPYASESVGTPNLNVDPELIRRFRPELLTSLRFCPVEHVGNLVRVLVVDPYDQRVAETVRQVLPEVMVTPLIGTDYDIRVLVDAAFGNALLDKSIDELRLTRPGESASRVLTRDQKLGFVALGAVFLVCVLLSPGTTLGITILILSVFYALSIAYKLVISLAGSRDDRQIDVRQADLRNLRNDDLPVYSILVPVYREPSVVPHLLAALGRMDYPQEKLDVLLLLEADDHETIRAAKAAAPPAHFRFIYVPDGQPRTKPKACNYGLSFCRGELVTIYDAEDIPEPDQLKKAVLAFRSGKPNLVCVQAALNYFNSNENYLTRMFALEYSYWFDYMVPGLDRLGLPIPLGGTSNHFRLDRLRELGAWDPFNVTEDADLGIRAAARGYEVGVIDSTTYEEANKAVGNWLRQRSRWIKGYMQTWLVHNRYPIPLLRRIGLRRWLSYQFFIGGTCLTFLSNPVMLVASLAWLVLRPVWLESMFTDATLAMATFNFLIGNMLGIYLNMLAVFRRKLFHLTPYALTNPVYWWLHSTAAYLAFWQLCTKPFYWEKTEHGLTSFSRAEILALPRASQPALSAEAAS